MYQKKKAENSFLHFVADFPYMLLCVTLVARRVFTLKLTYLVMRLTHARQIDSASYIM